MPDNYTVIKITFSHFPTDDDSPQSLHCMDDVDITHTFNLRPGGF